MSLPNHPFGVVTSPDGQWVFVSVARIGALLEFDHYMAPRTAPPFPEHVHLNQEERFEIIWPGYRARYS